MAFDNESTIQFHVRHYFPEFDRHKNFNATAKINKDGETYRIHMWADYVPSVDVATTTEPINVMINLMDKWKIDAAVNIKKNRGWV